MERPRFIVAQLGGRMHYAVPRILHSSGQLEKLYTDICALRGWPRLLHLIPNALRRTYVKRLLSRIPLGIPAAQINAFSWFGYEYSRRRRATARESQYRLHIWAGEEFCRRIVKAGFGSAQGVYTFNSAGLEVLRAARRSGLMGVVEQTIAPMRVELELLAEETFRYPGWEDSRQQEGASEYCDREKNEWEMADTILCGSEFVRNGIARASGPVEKCVVVPYGVDISVQKREPGNRNLKEPLRVLTVGAVNLRKGSPYVLEAARRLKGKAIFRMVGSVGVKREAEAQLRRGLELIGPVQRSELAAHFFWADVFVLPSLCEGSATVTYEALAYGLPVVCTPNTGSVVRDGLEGFIIPIRDSVAIVDRLTLFLDDPGLLRQISINATARAQEFTIEKYGDRLRNVLQMRSST